MCVFLCVCICVCMGYNATCRHRGFTDTVCLQNKTISLQTRYVYKTKQSSQTSYVYKHKTKQKVYKHAVYKTKQNKTFTYKLCLQNETNHNFYKQVMFTKQTNVYKTKVLQTRYLYKTKVFTNTLFLVFTCYNFVKFFHILLTRCANFCTISQLFTVSPR